MATYNLRRFANPSALKRIEPRLFLRFLAPYRSHFLESGLELPPPHETGRISYDDLVPLLMPSEGDLPKDLAEALWFMNASCLPKSRPGRRDSRSVLRPYSSG